MKSLVRSFAGLVFLATILFACIKRDNNNNNNNGNTNDTTVTTGTWRVSLFSERGQDETGDFTGYTFTFKNDGKLTVAKNGSSKEGTWSITNNRFNIDLGIKSDANKPLGELTDDWIIVLKNDTTISLKDDNAAKNEVLEFSKN
jgi:hypothetical protein